MAQKKNPKNKSSSQRSEREQRLLYEQKREAKLIEDILTEFKNFDENDIPKVSNEELQNVEPEYGFDMPDYVKALFSGAADEIKEEPVPTEADFKLDPKMFEPEPEPEPEPAPEPEPEPEKEIDFFAELFVKNSPSIEANHEKTAAIAVKEIEMALDEIEKTKVVPPIITESAGVEIAADDYSDETEVEPETEEVIETEHYSFDDDEEDDDIFSTRELRTEFFTAEIDEKVREMFTASLDNEDKKLGTRKMRSALATPEELGRNRSVEEVQEKKPKKKKKGKGLLIFMLIVFLGIFLFAGYKFGNTYLAQMQESQDLNDLANVVTHIKNGDNGTANVNGVDVEYSAEDDGSGRLLQYQQLAAMNEDMIGWLSIPNTVINYPVMYTPEDPEYYLRRDFIGDYSSTGMLFVEAQCDIENGDNQIIYGHNMKNDAMFGTLDDYADKEFWEDHQYLYYDTLYEEHIYQVVCVFESRVLNKDEEGFRYYRFYGSETEEEFNDYIEGIKNLQLYDTGVDVSYGDKLITLSTCAYFTDEGRFVVVAKQVS